MAVVDWAKVASDVETRLRDPSPYAMLSSVAVEGIETESRRSNVVFKPKDFFMAFGGVVCLVMEGFPVAVERLKEKMNEDAAMQDAGMTSEKMGAKWAKITLGAVRVEKYQFSTEQMLRLRTICLSFRSKIAEAAEECFMKSSSLSVVVFANRALTARPKETKISFDVGNSSDAVDLSENMKAKTADVIGPFFDAVTPDSTEAVSDVFQGYINDLNSSPAHSAHYLAPFPGATLVCNAFDNGCANTQLRGLIDEFRRVVDSNILVDVEGHPQQGQPLFEWFDDSALHVTVRGIS